MLLIIIIIVIVIVSICIRIPPVVSLLENQNIVVGFIVIL